MGFTCVTYNIQFGIGIDGRYDLDRIADAVLAWGDVDAIRKRVQEHFDAGADQVCLQVMPKAGGLLTPEDEVLLQELAPAA